MKAFEYAAPSTIEDAVKLLGAPGAAALSGGTDLIGRMKDYVTSPERVVYLKDIKSLAGISGDARAGGLTIGAGTKLTDIVASKEIREAYPALWQATVEIGSPQIRNMATVGRQFASASAVLVFPRRPRPPGHEGRQEPGPGGRQSVSRDLPDRRRRPVRQPLEPGRRPLAPWTPRRRSPGPRGNAPSRSKSFTRSPRARRTASSRSVPARSSPR